MCDQNNLNDQSVTNPKLKDLCCNLAYLLFIKVNPEANVCPNFNLTLMVNFTVLSLFNY